MDRSTINAHDIRRIIGQSSTDMLVTATSASSPGDADVPVLLQIFNIPLSYERFARDLRSARSAIRALDHPDILSIEGVERWQAEGAVATPAPGDDERLLLRLPAVEGVTLQSHLMQMQENGQRYSEEEALAFIARLARALAAALHKGIVHRTLHPHHVLVRDDGTPAILNLDMPVSLANALLAAGDDYHAFLSPEQSQRLTLDGRSNIYSLGALLYEMLRTGSPNAADWPLQRVQDEAAVAQALRAMRPDLSASTVRIVEQAMQPESWARHQTYDALLAAMGAGVASDPAPAQRTSRTRTTGAPPAPPARRRAFTGAFDGVPRPALLGGLALFLVVVALIWSNVGIPANVDPDAAQMGESDEGGDLTAPLSTRERQTPSPSPTGPGATPGEDNAVAADSSTPTFTPAAPLPASPTPQPTTEEAVSPSPQPQPTDTPEPTATLEPTATSEPPPPPPPQPTATPEPTATAQPTATNEPPPPPPPPPPTATLAPPTATSAPPTPTPPQPAPPSPTSEPTPLPSPTTQALAPTATRALVNQTF